MSKSKTQYVCSDCGETYPKWVGKCTNCGQWNTINEFREAKLTSSREPLTTGKDLTLVDQEEPEVFQNQQRISSRIEELDRLLGKGFFPGSFTLFGGSPGIGKSTLSMQTFVNIPNAYYFSGEESRHQVFSRAKRLYGEKDKYDFEQNIYSTNSLEDICTTIQKQNPPFAVIDSIQMVMREGGSLGQLSQIRENAEILMRLAKASGTAILVIGHVTKSEELAGPKILEHLVDAVLYLEGERNSELRLLRSIKNRFGSTQEVGVFEMTGTGLVELNNPSEFFLAERAANAFGSVVTVTREGARNFLLEIQALTVKTHFGLPRRTSHGIDLSKLHLLLAVVSKFTPFKCEGSDVYINVTGGLKVHEPAVDLAICAAVMSSFTEQEISAQTVILGEVGLSGEVRKVAGLELRLKEAARLGFKGAITPVLPPKFERPKGMVIKEVKTVTEMVAVLFRRS